MGDVIGVLRTDSRITVPCWFSYSRGEKICGLIPDSLKIVSRLVTPLSFRVIVVEPSEVEVFGKTFNRPFPAFSADGRPTTIAAGDSPLRI